MRHLYYPRCETLNHWRSFDAHFHDWAGSVSLLLLPITEANTSVMTSCNQCPLWFPWMQDVKSLTLRWCSFSGWGRDPLTTYCEHKGSQLIQKEHRRTIVNILPITAGYLNATMIRTIGNANRRLDPTDLATSDNTCPLTGTGLRLDCQRAAGQAFWSFWNWTELFFRSKHWPLAGYPDP